MTPGEEPLGSPLASKTIEQRIGALRWKYAKTYPDAPHEYILQQWDPEVFAYFVEKLRTEGAVRSTRYEAELICTVTSIQGTGTVTGSLAMY